MKSLQQLRKENELTQSELAEKLGVDQSYISKIENGVFHLTDAIMLFKLSEALGVSLSDIAPTNMPCHKHFPAFVHGKIVYNLAELIDALTENEDICEGCKKLVKDLRNYLLDQPKFRMKVLERWFQEDPEGFLEMLAKHNPRVFKEVMKILSKENSSG